MLIHHLPASETPFQWRADDGPFIAVYAYSIPPPPPHQLKKKYIKFGPPLTKLSGSKHVNS